MNNVEDVAYDGDGDVAYDGDGDVTHDDDMMVMVMVMFAMFLPLEPCVAIGIASHDLTPLSTLQLLLLH